MRAFAVALLAAAACAHQASASALWDYVHRDDGVFSWFDTGITYRNNSGWTGFLLNVTSQQWLTPEDSDRSIWTHQLFVVIPDNITDKTHAAIYATGGDNGQGPPKDPLADEDTLVSIVLAQATGTVTATLWQIPNQPVVFSSDPQHQSRSEDAAVAWTWKMFVETGNPDWIMYFPMAKSVVKAMDAVTEFVAEETGMQLEKWLVAGASKRGWTTWFTGVVDDRIVGIAPIVMDLLNITHNLPHMWRAYGGWTFAFEDYYSLNITNWLGTSKFDKLASVIDPLVYKENLTMPKLVIDATGDEFFMPDDDYYWWGSLPGETYRLMIQNAEHSMATGVIELISGVIPWYQSFLYGTKRPSMDWSIAQGSGKITLNVDTSVLEPTSVTLQHATTFGAERRDFRLIKGNTPSDPCKFIPVHIFGSACINPIIWWPEEVQPTTKASNTWTYELTQPMPASGWAGFFAEVKFPGPVPATEYRLTTQVSIIPQTFPFPPCGSGAECHGTLV